VGAGDQIRRGELSKIGTDSGSVAGTVVCEVFGAAILNLDAVEHAQIARILRNKKIPVHTPAATQIKVPERDDAISPISADGESQESNISTSGPDRYQHKPAKRAIFKRKDRRIQGHSSKLLLGTETPNTIIDRKIVQCIV
jgi:hypothetical protein